MHHHVLFLGTSGRVSDQLKMCLFLKRSLKVARKFFGWFFLFNLDLHCKDKYEVYLPTSAKSVHRLFKVEFILTCQFYTHGSRLTPLYLGLSPQLCERLHFHFSLSCVGVGNGNPLQYSCLENLRDRGAWWAAVYGVAQIRTRLK